jgi:hypothetical protein
MPLLPRASKSVIGSMLEREPVITPAHHWDSTDLLLCAGVVFGTGDKFRTGEASGPDTVEEQWEIGRVQMNPFGHSHVDFQRLIMGAHGISTAQYDPYDSASLKAARQFIDELFDPPSGFNHYGVPSRGGCLQIEPVTHIHQNWGPLYDNYDVWLKKIKKMLDPNTVGDWTAYIPPEYPDYKKDGNYVIPTYGKDEKL